MRKITLAIILGSTTVANADLVDTTKEYGNKVMFVVWGNTSN